MRAPAESTGRRLESGSQRTGKGAKVQKDVKFDGTNSVKSFRINTSVKKRTQNELVFAGKNCQSRPKKLRKSQQEAKNS
jgi:hypothetical protein